MTSAMTGPAGTLLVIDYPGRRAEARIRDLHLEQAGWRLVHLIEPLVRDRYTAEAYAGELAARIPPADDIRAVLAYCTGAAVAQHVAVHVGDRVPLMLFDGTPVTARLIVRDFLAAVAQISGQRPARPPEGAPLTDIELTTRPAQAFAWIRDTLARLAADALRADVPEDGLPAATAGICAVYLDWLAFLIAGRNAAWPTWGGDVMHIVSRRHSFTGHWQGSRRTFIHVIDSGTRELLTTGQARERVLACLGSVTNSV
jgi:pimeloyl-ACP methyl ester carboxylesterase